MSANDEIHELMGRHASIPGLLGWVVYQAGGSVVSRPCVSWLQSTVLEQALGPVLNAVQALSESGLVPVVLSWSFEQAHVKVKFSVSGAGLLLVLEGNQHNANAVEALFREFNELNWSATS